MMLRDRPLSAPLSRCLLLLTALGLLGWSVEAHGFGMRLQHRTSSKRGGYFDGKDYELSLYFQPQFGYESNYKFTNADIEGSAVWGTSSGAEFKWRPNSKMYLRSELGASVLMPIADPSLTGFLVELPVLFFYNFSDTFQLFLSNHVAVERERSPPVFFDTDVFQSLINESKTILFLAIYEQFRPAVAFKPIKNLMIDAGPYFRVKQVQFNQNPADGDPDYRLFDLAGDIAVGYRFLEHFRVRAHYDFALRLYQNVPPRQSDNTAITGESLQALRHYGDLRLGFSHPWLTAFAGYGFRHNSDNGGSLDYTEHHLLTGVAFRYKEKLRIGAQFFFALRNYFNRTACEASPEDPAAGCGAADPNNNAPQNTSESLMILTIDASYSITDWLEISAQYVLEDAEASGADNVPIGTPTIADPQGANHRVLGGVSLNI